VFSAPTFVEQYASAIAVLGGLAVLSFAALQVYFVLKKGNQNKKHKTGRRLQ
jgi:hypothetical protein